MITSNYPALAHPEPTSFNASLVATAVSTCGIYVKTFDFPVDDLDACEQARYFQTRENEHRFDVQAEQRFDYENSGLAMEVNRELAAIRWADL